MSEWTIADVARATGAETRSASPALLARPATGAVLDSRRAQAGRVFVALPGSRADGHAYAAEAFARGAAAAIVAQARVGTLPADLGPLLVVEECEAALGVWARARRAAWTGDLVGLCGSNGKTTTKEMLAAILAERAPTGKTEGNLNNQLGVPVTLTRLAERERYAVVEIGMNHPGEVRALSALARPTAAVITNIAPEHLEGLGTLEAVARAEAEVAEALPAGAPLVLPAGEAALDAAVRALEVKRVTFGVGVAADCVGESIESLGEAGMRFRVAGFPPLEVPVPGRHSVNNALAAIACARALGMTPDECARGLARTAPPAGRMQVARAGGVTLLLDHYNANPGSMAAGLDTLEAWPGAKRRWAALGDMLELGDAAASYHAALGRRLGRIDGAYLWGELMANAERAARDAGLPAERVRRFATRDELGKALARLVQPGDVVLVKGSRGSAMEEVVAALEASLGAAPSAAGGGR
jgi:UDP-N-acetylmuramoyl-tripeptide--D-alanyl-D-alanine ligase